MIYVINNKYYINIAPSIYKEVIVSSNGTIQPTNDKIEINGHTKIETINIKDILCKSKKDNVSTQKQIRTVQKYNRRKK